MGLEAFNGAISISLNLEDELGANSFSSFWKVIDHCEGTHVLEGLNLLFNCLFPLFSIRTVQRFMECGWFLVASRACTRSSKGKCNLSESFFICIWVLSWWNIWNIGNRWWWFLNISLREATRTWSIYDRWCT